MNTEFEFEKTGKIYLQRGELPLSVYVMRFSPHKDRSKATHTNPPALEELLHSEGSTCTSGHSGYLISSITTVPKWIH